VSNAGKGSRAAESLGRREKREIWVQAGYSKGGGGRAFSGEADMQKAFLRGGGGGDVVGDGGLGGNLVRLGDVNIK